MKTVTENGDGTYTIDGKIYGEKALSSETETSINEHAEDAVSDAHRKLRAIAASVRGNWIPNWEDPTQKKWFPIFRMQGGFACIITNFTYGHSHTMVSSRFCFPTFEMAERFGKENIELYKIIMTTD